jgi:hypothetical protein
MWPIGRGATLADVVPTGLMEIVDAVEQHGLDVARRAAARTGPLDLTTLVGHFSDELRASDKSLQALVVDLRDQERRRQLCP